MAEDKAAESELHRTYLDLGVLTRNEVRLELGYGAAEGGDAILVPSDLARLADVAAEHENAARSGERVGTGFEPDDENGDRSEGEEAESQELAAVLRRRVGHVAFWRKSRLRPPPETHLDEIIILKLNVIVFALH